MLRRLLGINLTHRHFLGDWCFLDHYARLVYLEIIIALKFSCHRTIHEHFFPYLHLSRREVVTIDVVTLSHPGIWLAVLVVGALMTLGSSCVRCAIFSDKTGILGKEAVEDGPAAVAALVHVVALHHELRREGRLITEVTELELHSCFDSLDESHGVAGAALSLVANGTREVVSIDIPEIVVLGDLVVRYVIRRLKVLHPILGSLNCFLEYVGVLTKYSLTRFLVLFLLFFKVFRLRRLRFAGCLCLCFIVFFSCLILSRLIFFIFLGITECLRESLHGYPII